MANGDCCYLRCPVFVDGDRLDLSGIVKHSDSQVEMAKLPETIKIQFNYGEVKQMIDKVLQEYGIETTHTAPPELIEALMKAEITKYVPEEFRVL